MMSMERRRIGAAIIASVALGVAAAGCGLSKSTSEGDSSADSSATADPKVAAAVDAATAAMKDASAPVSELQSNGEPFDVSSSKGKTIGVVAATTVDPGYRVQFSAFSDAAKLLGFDVKVCDGEGFNPASIARCIGLFTNQHVDGMVLQSADPSLFQGPLKAAHDAGIKIVSINTSYEGQDLVPNVDGQVAWPYLSAAKLEAESVMSLSKGNANALVITSSDYVNSPAMEKQIKDYFDENCPDCKIDIRDVPIADWETKLTPLVQATVQSDPNIRYVVPLFDTEVPAVNAGIAAANANDRISVVTMAGTPGIIDNIKNPSSPLKVDIGGSQVHLGWAWADALARLFAGEQDTDALKNSNLTLRLFDQSNIDTLNLDDPNSWYGDDFDPASHYKQQWTLGS